ncbi:hypothetical protein [Novosphingobium sp.]|uniref:hypothetical protein n=1 Tax=Novosphingobium sp. TaxID=1874826 RepID=UPI0025D067F0|nr:hypothetical protein [Novosphingobium sp.]
MAHAFTLVARQTIALSPDAARRVMIYTCALALIGASYFAPAAAASTVCMADRAFAASFS